MLHGKTFLQREFGVGGALGCRGGGGHFKRVFLPEQLCEATSMVLGVGEVFAGSEAFVMVGTGDKDVHMFVCVRVRGKGVFGGSVYTRV